MYNEIHEPVKVMLKAESVHDNDNFFKGYDDRISYIKQMAQDVKRDLSSSSDNKDREDED